MERFVEQAYLSVKNYRMKKCCFIAPLKPGLLVLGYLNIIISLILIVGSASDSLNTTFAVIQHALFEEHSNSTPVLQPSLDLIFNVVLVSGLHRNDRILLNVYVYYGLASIVLTVVVYAIVMINLRAIHIFIIIFNILYQAYLIFLVRSQIVEIRRFEETHKYNNAFRSQKTPYNGETNNQSNNGGNVAKTEPITELKPIEVTIKKDTEETKVEIINEVKPEVKFEKVTKGAIARLGDTTKNSSVSKEIVASAKPSCSNVDSSVSTSASATTSLKENPKAITKKETITKKINDTKDGTKETAKEDLKVIETIPEEPTKEESKKDIPIPKKRGFFKRKIVSTNK